MMTSRQDQPTDRDVTLVTVARFRQGLEANLVRGLLENERIPTVVTNEHLVGINWLYSDAIGGVEVKVEADQVDAALSVLDAALDESEDALDAHADADVAERSTCLECGSTKVARSSGFWVKAFGSMLILLVSAMMIPFMILALPVLGRSRRQRCLKCGQTSLRAD